MKTGDEEKGRRSGRWGFEAFFQSSLILLGKYSSGSIISWYIYRTIPSVIKPFNHKNFS